GGCSATPRGTPAPGPSRGSAPEAGRPGDDDAADQPAAEPSAGQTAAPRAPRAPGVASRWRQAAVARTRRRVWGSVHVIGHPAAPLTLHRPGHGAGAGPVGADDLLRILAQGLLPA